MGKSTMEVLLWSPTCKILTFVHSHTLKIGKPTSFFICSIPLVPLKWALTFVYIGLTEATLFPHLSPFPVIIFFCSHFLSSASPTMLFNILSPTLSPHQADYANNIPITTSHIPRNHPETPTPTHTHVIEKSMLWLSLKCVV